MFKTFIKNEEQAHLAHKINSILTAVQELEEDMGAMGLRHIAKVCEDIVVQFRKILHNNWGMKQHANLKQIQKIAVALQKAIEDKDNLKELIPLVSKELQKLSAKLGEKTNNLKAPKA